MERYLLSSVQHPAQSHRKRNASFVECCASHLHLSVAFVVWLGLLLAFPSLSTAQNSDAFFFAPGLEFDLPPAAWGRKRQTYDEAMFHPGRKRLVNQGEDITIQIVCELNEELEVRPDSLDWLSEAKLAAYGATFRKETVNGFTLYLVDRSHNDFGKFEYLAHAIHPWGYFASLSMSIGAASKREADGKVRSILQNTFLRTPAEVDKALGLPYPASTDLDSLFQAKIEEIRKFNKGKFPDDYLESELARLKKEDLIAVAMDGYSWEKCYRVRAQIQAGALSLDDALNHHFLQIDAPDIAFFRREFRGRDLSPLHDGVAKVIQRHCAPAADSTRFDYFFMNQHEFYDDTKTYYWAMSRAKDSSACLLLCYWRENGKWSMHQRKIDYPWKAASDLMHDHLPHRYQDPHDYTGEPHFPKQHQVNTVEAVDREDDPTRTQAWAFNALLPQSNIVALPSYHGCDPSYDVAYLISDIHAINGRAEVRNPPGPPDVRDSTDFQTTYAAAYAQQFTLEGILADTALVRQLSKTTELHIVLQGRHQHTDFYMSPSDTAEWEEVALEAACVIRSRQLPPNRRLYVAAPQFVDLDGDGKEELLQFKVADGRLLDYFLIEADGEGVQRLPPSKALEAKVLQTEFFLALKRMSLQQENLLERWWE